MVHALALMLLSLAPQECGSAATADQTDRAAYEVLRGIILADADGRAPDPDRYRTHEGEPLPAEVLARLPRGWLAGPDPAAARDVGIWSLNRSGYSDNVMLVRIGEAGSAAALSRRVHLRCQSGQWNLTFVARHPEADDLDALLSETASED